MWKKIVGAPSMDGLVRRPDLLSFYVASKIPVSVSTRQELLEIDGISYRLQREIELLESVNLIQCKHCQVINIFALFKPVCVCVCVCVSCCSMDMQ
jgi:cereblon